MKKLMYFTIVLGLIATDLGAAQQAVQAKNQSIQGRVSREANVWKRGIAAAKKRHIQKESLSRQELRYYKVVLKRLGGLTALLAAIGIGVAGVRQWQQQREEAEARAARQASKPFKLPHRSERYNELRAATVLADANIRGIESNIQFIEKIISKLRAELRRSNRYSEQQKMQIDKPEGLQEFWTSDVADRFEGDDWWGVSDDVLFNAKKQSTFHKEYTSYYSTYEDKHPWSVSIKRVTPDTIVGTATTTLGGANYSGPTYRAMINESMQGFENRKRGYEKKLQEAKAMKDDAARAWKHYSD